MNKSKIGNVSFVNFSKINKRAAMGEGIMMIYRLLLVAFIAFVVMGISSVFYSHYIDVRDSEAKILSREVVDCISPSGVLDLDKISEKNYNNILVYCGFDESELERFYVEVEVGDVKLFQGDSGKLWVLEIFNNVKTGEGLKKYEPGYYSWNYPVYVLKGGNKIRSEATVKVLVSDEF